MIDAIFLKVVCRRLFLSPVMMKTHTLGIHPRKVDRLGSSEPVLIVDPGIQDRDGDEFVEGDLGWYRQRPHVRQDRLVLFKQENRTHLGYSNTGTLKSHPCPNLGAYHEINWASRKHLSTDTLVPLQSVIN
jgi:hypothetical protein